MTGVSFPWHTLCGPEERPPAGKNVRRKPDRWVAFPSGSDEAAPQLSHLRGFGGPNRLLPFLAIFLRLHSTRPVPYRMGLVEPFLPRRRGQAPVTSSRVSPLVSPAKRAGSQNKASRRTGCRPFPDERRGGIRRPSRRWED